MVSRGGEREREREKNQWGSEAAGGRPESSMGRRRHLSMGEEPASPTFPSAFLSLRNRALCRVDTDVTRRTERNRRAAQCCRRKKRVREQNKAFSATPRAELEGPSPRRPRFLRPSRSLASPFSALSLPPPLQDPLFAPNAVHGLSLSANRDLTLERLLRYVRRGQFFSVRDYGRDPRRFMAGLESLALVDYSLCIKAGVHFTLCVVRFLLETGSGGVLPGERVLFYPLPPSILSL